MFKLGNVVVTRRRNYDTLKHLIANYVLIHKETRLPSVRDLSDILGVNKSSISRALIQLCEVDRWLDKIDNGSIRNSYYTIIANEEQCEQYKNYYLLPARKKAKFRKLSKDVRQKAEVGRSQSFSFGSAEWTKEVQQYQTK